MGEANEDLTPSYKRSSKSVKQLLETVRNSGITSELSEVWDGGEGF